MTLRAVEAGEPTPSIGSYLRVMRALGVSHDLALLATDAVEYPRRAGDAVARAEHAVVAVSNARHELQDLQSLALHQEAVRRMKQDPRLTNQAMDTLNRWRSEGAPTQSISGTSGRSSSTAEHGGALFRTPNMHGSCAKRHRSRPCCRRKRGSGF
jgi:hypothetical protein